MWEERGAVYLFDECSMTWSAHRIWNLYTSSFRPIVTQDVYRPWAVSSLNDTGTRLSHRGVLGYDWCLLHGKTKRLRKTLFYNISFQVDNAVKRKTLMMMWSGLNTSWAHGFAWRHASTRGGCRQTIALVTIKHSPAHRFLGHHIVILHQKLLITHSLDCPPRGMGFYCTPKESKLQYYTS